jgi:hypothetical protein
MFGDPTKDLHRPDVALNVKYGVIYSLSKKNTEHGGFAGDDSHVVYS